MLVSRQKLRFLAGPGLTPDLEAQEAGVRRFIGRELQDLSGQGFAPARYSWAHRDGNGVPSGPVESHHHFMPTGNIETLPYRHFYVRAAREGHLIPADEATAKACGLKWEGIEKARAQAAGANPSPERDEENAPAPAAPETKPATPNARDAFHAEEH